MTVTPKRREIEIPLADGTAFPALLVSPVEPAGVVLLVHDLFGRRPFYDDLAEEIASHGFEVALPDFFAALGPLPEPTIAHAVARRRALDEQATFERFRSVIEWLRGRPGHAGRVGTVGFCMGGTFALDLSAYERDLATVSFYGFPRPQRELAFPPPAPLDLVERLEGPILAIWGEDDDQVGMEHVEEFARRCRAAGPRGRSRILPGLGHSFLTSLPADERLQAVARHAWQDAIEHLDARRSDRPAAVGARSPPAARRATVTRSSLPRTAAALSPARALSPPAPRQAPCPKPRDLLVAHDRRAVRSPMEEGCPSPRRSARVRPTPTRFAHPAAGRCHAGAGRLAVRGRIAVGPTVSLPARIRIECACRRCDADCGADRRRP